jgi:uncharacterized lipoprotein YddW (UPF0748 family)
VLHGGEEGNLLERMASRVVAWAMQLFFSPFWRRSPALILLLLLYLVFPPLTLLSEVSPEMRGMWITRFEWPDREGDADKMRERIREIMATLGENHFNAVYFQIRGQADVLYPSPYEPWSPLIGGKDPGFDPLEFAIAEARRNDLEFHAYINPFPSWQDEGTPPADPDHPYNRFPEWECLLENGEKVFAEYYYFSPGNPHVHAWVRKVIRDIVERYDVDGIHLDRIRYPDPRSCHDPVSRERFAGIGNPRQLEWEDWQREQITRFVYDLYGELQLVKPEVKLTAAVWGIYDRYRLEGYSDFSSGFHQFYQDSFAWMRLQAMDALVPMIYWPIGGNRPHYDELYADFLEHGAYGRHIYGGTASGHQPEQVKSAIEFTRQVNGHGTVAFSITNAERRDRWPVYRQVFEQPALVPGMPWKNRDAVGHVAGRVVDAEGNPVTDAWIRMEGMRSVWLSSGDGFFAILNAAPGDQVLLVQHGDGPVSTQRVNIPRGAVAEVEVRMGE